MKTALVMSGGGSKGAFTVGAFEVLRNSGVDFDVISGTSTGALIAPLAATDEVDLLKSIYLNVETKDILTRRGFLGIPFSLKSVFDTKPLEDLIEEMITEDRFDRIMRSPRQILLTTTNLVTGHLMYWSNHKPSQDQADEGVHLITDLDTMRRALLASSNQPLLMPTVPVPLGADPQVDGGVREIAPLRIAIHSGAREIYAILVNPEHPVHKDKNYDNMVIAGLRALELQLQEVLLNDVATARTYNRAVKYLNAAMSRASAMGIDSTEIEAIFDAEGDENPLKGKTLLDLTVIRPDFELPAKTLEFDKSDMAQMMNIGRVIANRELKLVQTPEPDVVPH